MKRYLLPGSSRRGLIYTSFAIISASLLLMISAMPLNPNIDTDSGDASRISEAAFFVDSVLGDMERSLEISTRRAITGATGYVIDNGESLVAPGDNITSALVNGTISGQDLNSTENATLEDWTFRVRDIADRSGYSMNIQLENTSFNPSRFEVESSYSVSARLKDPTTLANFNRTKEANTTVSIEGLEDTMILLQSKGRYVSQYERCGFNDPAEQLNTGDFHSGGEIHGKAVVNPATSSIGSIDNKSEKVLVVDDIEDPYDASDADGFAAVVSAQDNDTTSGSDYSTNFVFDLSGTSSIQDIEENMSIIVFEDQVWRSSFREMFQENCYLRDNDGPGFFDRLSNNPSSSGGNQGIATLIDVSELPTQLQKDDSAVGYIYFGSSSSTNREIRGVTNEHSWFRLDQEHIDEWDLNPIAHN